jgi:hypothetical protein
VCVYIIFMYVYIYKPKYVLHPSLQHDARFKEPRPLYWCKATCRRATVNPVVE